MVLKNPDFGPCMGIFKTDTTKVQFILPYLNMQALNISYLGLDFFIQVFIIKLPHVVDDVMKNGHF